VVLVLSDCGSHKVVYFQGGVEWVLFVLCHQISRFSRLQEISLMKCNREPLPLAL
jgi:hypothetical protein